jgi:exopolyphosphatase/guanosine-5'-triphosphate,3'-diphosphate pyrophosphatase
LEVISGEDEARLAFLGAGTQPGLETLPMLLLDTGGGSTEFIVGRAGQSHFHASFPLGAVRLAEQQPVGDPPAAAELARCRDKIRGLLESQVAPRLRPALARETGDLALVASGGTASVLAMMELGLREFDRARIEAVRLPDANVRAWVERLWTLPLARRRELPGLPPERADIILFGVAIFEAIQEVFGLNSLRVSTRGLRFGALLESAP